MYIDIISQVVPQASIISQLRPLRITTVFLESAPRRCDVGLKMHLESAPANMAIFTNHDGDIVIIVIYIYSIVLSIMLYLQTFVDRFMIGECLACYCVSPAR